jgi:hypothetical protein
MAVKLVELFKLPEPTTIGDFQATHVGKAAHSEPKMVLWWTTEVELYTFTFLYNGNDAYIMDSPEQPFGTHAPNTTRLVREKLAKKSPSYADLVANAEYVL